MGMRVITVDNLCNYITATTGRFHYIVTSPDKKVITDGVNIACTLERKFVTDYDSAAPYLKVRDQVNGVLKIYGKPVVYDDLQGYIYII